MRTIRITFKTLLVAMVVTSFAGAAWAQLNINEMAAGVALPFLTSATGVTTKSVVTNTSAGERTLHFDLINGDPGEQCDTQSWICTLTARETVQIQFTNFIGGSLVTFECDGIEGNPQGVPPFAGSDGVVVSNAAQGVLWVTVVNAVNDTVAENVLYGDWTVLDVPGSAAYSAPGAGFQGILNDGDKQYVMDGLEYANYPDSLATNFLPPLVHPGTLLAFTLDFTAGNPPLAIANVFWYDDDELFEDDSFPIDCFDLVPYGAIAPGLALLNTPGHLEITPVTAPNGPPHSPDGDRRVPLLCYNIQDAPLVGDPPNQLGGGTTVRACAQSVAKFVPDDGDSEPNLDTQN
jgi:hypothetical protein